MHSNHVQVTTATKFKWRAKLEDDIRMQPQQAVCTIHTKGNDLTLTCSDRLMQCDFEVTVQGPKMPRCQSHLNDVAGFSSTDIDGTRHVVTPCINTLVCQRPHKRVANLFQAVLQCFVNNTLHDTTALISEHANKDQHGARPLRLCRQASCEKRSL